MKASAFRRGSVWVAWTIGWTTTALLSGAAFSGELDGLGRATWIREGEQAGAGFGTVLGGGGDINGDRLGDLLIGEPAYRVGTNPPVGRVLLFLGSREGFRMEPDQAILGTDPGGRFGFHVAILGDLNGDGFADVGIGAPSFHGGLQEQGRVDIHLGSEAGLEPSPRWSRAGGQADMQLGRIHRAGDVNGDSFDDVVTGASDGGVMPSGGGEALLFLGSRTGLTHTVIWRRKGTQKTELLGDVVAGVGDLNGDGYGDVVFGTMLYDGVTENEGRVEIFLGTAGGLSADPVWTGLPSGVWKSWAGPVHEARFGSAVSAAGDINGDGIPDLIVGSSHMANGDEKEGHALVWYGNPAGLSSAPEWKAEGNEVSGHFGTGVAGVGDVNGDGLDDLVVTGRTLDHGEVNEGVVALYLGRGPGRGLPTWPDWTLESNERGAELGGVVVALGDADGDGLADFAVGGRYHSRNDSQLGEVRVVWGRHGPWGDGSGWSPKLPWTERLRRALDRGMASAGGWLLVGITLVVVGGGMALIRLSASRRRTQLEVETMRSRLHDFVGAELAGANPPDRRLRRFMEELRATVWALKQDAPTVAGLIGYLSDWAWRFAREKAVTLRLDLPRHEVRHQVIDLEIAELFQAILRRALAEAVETQEARRIELVVVVERKALTMEVRHEVGRSLGVIAPGAEESDLGGQADDWTVLQEKLEGWGGRLEFTLAGDGGGCVRAVSPYKAARGWKTPWKK